MLRRVRLFLSLSTVLFCLLSAERGVAQTVAGPERPTVLSGYATDPDHAAIPNAHISVDGPTATDHFEATSDGVGFFDVIGLKPGVAYRVTITAQGFSTASAQGVVLAPSQQMEMDAPALHPAAEASVDAITAEEAASMAVHEAESQRVLGLVPNFYVVYPGAVYAPLSTKLKFQLATKAATDPVTFGAVALYAGMDQAAFTPSYVEGARGYFQRVGSGYAGAAGNMLVGGAILPSLLHQDPRYFVQGTGTKKSRALHAFSAPFLCRGDNGHTQFNASSIGGDLVSSSLLNVYYPPADRGVSLVLSNAALNTGGRILNAMLQEFVLGKLTTGKHQR